MNAYNRKSVESDNKNTNKLPVELGLDKKFENKLEVELESNGDFEEKYKKVKIKESQITKSNDSKKLEKLVVNKYLKWIFVPLTILFVCFVSYLFIYKKVLSKRKLYRTAICSIGKMENKYLKEWVDHYKELGVDTIFLYDNNEIDGERFDEVIKNEINKGFVKVINFRGVNQGNPLIKAYQDCTEKNLKDYDWLMFYDVDEFLTIANKTLQEFLSNEKFKECENIKINWIVIGDNGYTHYENKPLKERFKYPRIKMKTIKSMIRGKSNINFEWREFGPHEPFNYKHSCNSYGEKIKVGIIFVDGCYDNAYIEHYETKSTEEFITKKIIRGARPDKDFESIQSKLDYLNGAFHYYFSFNELTSEKLDMVEKGTNMTFPDLRKKLQIKFKL